MRWSIADRNVVAPPGQWLGSAQRGTKVLRKFLTRRNWKPETVKLFLTFHRSPRSCIFTRGVGLTQIQTGKLKTSRPKMKTAWARAWAFATLFPLLTLPQFAGAQSKPAADLIIRNAKVWTADKKH